MARLILCVIVLIQHATAAVGQDDNRFTLRVAAELENSGLMAYLLPRFALKSGRRAELVADGADMEIDSAGPEDTPLLAREDRIYAIVAQNDNAAAALFASWIGSEIGQNAITAFVPAEGVRFSAAPAEAEVTVIVFDGDAALGARLAKAHCGRCHRVDAERTGMGIGSTPSFPALRSLADWDERFLSFYALNPHPAFLRVAEVSPPFDPAFPPAIHPVELTLAEVEAIQAYAAALEPMDLGAPVQSN